MYKENTQRNLNILKQETLDQIRQIYMKFDSQVYESNYVSTKDQEKSSYQFQQINTIIETLFEKIKNQCKKIDFVQSPQVTQIVQNYQEVIEQKNQQIFYLEKELDKKTASFSNQKQKINQKIKLLQNILQKKHGLSSLNQNEYDNLQDQMQSFQAQLEQTQIEKEQVYIENQKMITFVESINQKLKVLQDIETGLKQELKTANQKVFVSQKGFGIEKFKKQRKNKIFKI